MKKKITALGLIIVFLFSLVACGKFTCDGCGEEKSGKSYKATFLGEEGTFCKDCKKELDELKEGLFGE